MASTSSGPRPESPNRGTECTSSEHNNAYFIPRSEAPVNASPDQLLALFVALAAEINSNQTIRDRKGLENLINKDVGISNIHTSFVGNGFSFNVRAWKFGKEERGLILKSTMPSAYKFDRKEEKRRLSDVILELRALSHPALRSRENIVELLGLGWETDSFEGERKWPVLILECADGGTLMDLLHRESLSRQAKLRICYNIACGLATLHDIGIIHGDIKPQNVLMFLGPSTLHEERHWIAKLSDFGAAVMDKSDKELDILGTGTVPWNAPEWKKEIRPTDMILTDIYSFGLVIWSIATDGLDPFAETSKLFSFPPNCESEERRNLTQTFKLDGDKFLATLTGAENASLIREFDTQCLKRLLACTVQLVPQLRSLEDTIAILEDETGEVMAIPELKQWQRHPKGLEDMLIGSNDLDTLDPIIRIYIKKRLEDSYARSPETWQRRSAAFNLAIESLADNDPEKGSKDCLLWLLKAAELGSQSAQSIVYRFHVALGQPISDDMLAKCKQWVMEAAARGFPAAQEDLALLATTEECVLVKERFRRRYAGIGQNRFASNYASLELTFDEWDVKITEILSRRFEEPSGPKEFPMNNLGDNILHFAASAGFLSVINLWRQPRPIDINCTGNGGETALLHACRSGHYEVTLALLEVGADPTIACDNGDTSLHWLLSFDTEHIPEIAFGLFKKGAHPNAVAKNIQFPYAPECDYTRGTALHRAVERGNVTAVRALLDIGAKADFPWDLPDGYTPLNLAAFLHRSEILDILLSSLGKAEPASAVYAGMSLLAPAIGGEYFHGERFTKIARHGPSWWSETEKTLHILGKHGARKHLHGLPEGSQGAGVSALFLATTQGDAKTLEYFLNHGSLSDVDVKSRYRPDDTLRTPLNKAISGRRRDSFMVLLKYGADPCALHLDENGDQLTYLHECASNGHSDSFFAEQIVSRGVPIDDPGPSNYETPFACAVRNRAFGLASWLLEKGANPNVEYSRGFMFEMPFPRSLLGILIKEQSISTLVCLDYIFKNVPNPNFVAASVQNYTVLHAVAQIREAGRDDVALNLILDSLLGFFKPSKAQANALSLDGYTALHFATFTANIDVVDKLLANGADPLVKNADGFSPLEQSQLALTHIDESPSSYIDSEDPMSEKEQLILARRRREKVNQLLSKYSLKPSNTVTIIIRK